MKLRIGMLQRLEKTKSNLLDTILQNPSEKSWSSKTKQLMKDVKCEHTTDQDESKSSRKKRVKEAINRFFHHNITMASRDKSKPQHLIEGIGKWTPGNRPLLERVLSCLELYLSISCITRKV